MDTLIVASNPTNASHAHYCHTCEGWSPCHGVVSCLLVDSCPKCGRIPFGDIRLIVGK